MGFTLSGEKPTENVSSLLSNALEHPKNKWARLLITIDEV